MYRNKNGVSSSTAVNGTNGVKHTKKDEELWPEEAPSSAPLDEFERMEKEILSEIKQENGEKTKKGKKKKKKSDKENKKSAFENKGDIYAKHVGPRIRSFDPAKMKSKFNKPKEPTQVSNECRICGKIVFQMEKIVAEKAAWHKNCFKCKECNKTLTLETYQSHEGSLYCKPHFKELFRPKAVMQDEEEQRKDRLLRRPRMIVLESKPEALPDDVVRATSKPDYGLDELQQTLNVKQRFAVFENLTKEEEQPRTEPVSVRRSQSLMSKAARFLEGQEERPNDVEYDEEEDEDDEEEAEEEEAYDEEGNQIVRGSKKKKERPMSFSGMGDLKAAWEQKQRRDEMSQGRKEEISRFRQMLCAGKNSTLKEKFESGNFNEDDLIREENENDNSGRMRDQIKIETRHDARSLLKKFEQGQPFNVEEQSDDENEQMEEGQDNGEVIKRRKKNRRITLERDDVDEIFKDAETAKTARNVFKQIDSTVSAEGGSSVIMRSQSFATNNRDNRRSVDASFLTLQQQRSVNDDVEIVKSDDKSDDFQVDTTDLVSRFKFFSNYEKDTEDQREKSRKVFRMTPPREAQKVPEAVLLTKGTMPKTCMAVNCAGCKLIRELQGVDNSEVLGRDVNLIKCTDNYQDKVDCTNTKNILNMFKKLEMGEDALEDDNGPRPLKRFTPPPDGVSKFDEVDDDDSEEYSDEEYTDDDDDEEDEEEEEEDEDGKLRPKVRDELLQMSARKAANLRAKFERWENHNGTNGDSAVNGDAPPTGDEACMPSLDTAKNLRAIFESKANESVKPISSKQGPQKVNRFV